MAKMKSLGKVAKGKSVLAASPMKQMGAKCPKGK